MYDKQHQRVITAILEAGADARDFTAPAPFDHTWPEHRLAADVRTALQSLRDNMGMQRPPLYTSQEKAFARYLGDPVVNRLIANFGGVIVGGAVRDVLRVAIARPRDIDIHVTWEAAQTSAWAAFVEGLPPARSSARDFPGVARVDTWEREGAIPVQAIVLAAGQTTAGQCAAYFDSTANAVTWSPAEGLVSYGPGWEDARGGYYRPHWPGIFACTGPVTYMARVIKRLQSGHGWRLTDLDLDAVRALAAAHLGGPASWSAVHPSGTATPSIGGRQEEEDPF